MNLFVLEHGEPRAKTEDATFLSISEWKQLLSRKGVLRPTSEADVYELVDPHGRPHLLDLTPWAGRDPDETLLTIGFRWRDPKKVGSRLSGQRIKR